MTIYQGEGKGAAREIKQNQVFVQFGEEARGGGALQAGLTPWAAVRALER